MKSNFRSGAKRYARKAIKYVKKRYVSRKGLPRMRNIVKDLAVVKSMVNAEKEIYNAHQASNAAFSPTSAYISAITNVAEGTSHGQRDGESLKLHGFRWNLRFSQQGSAVTDQYIKYWLVTFKGPRAATPSLDMFLLPDFDGNYSASSERNADWYNSWAVHASGRVHVQPDTVTSVSRYVLAKKFGRFRGDTHQRYSGALATTLLTDQMYIIAVAANGAVGSSTAAMMDSLLQISFYDN